MGELTVRSVRNGLSDYVGSRVQVKSNLGRRKYDILEGVIKDLYPCIFTIEVDGKDDSPQLYSYSYTDVITKDVQLRLC
ncbi:MAG: Veg family protein [Eubacterium sp.]|nr:Veg family protein [Eubacterium sp.]